MLKKEKKKDCYLGHTGYILQCKEYQLPKKNTKAMLPIPGRVLKVAYTSFYYQGIIR